ncbi:MAG: hypothetical protein J07HB67_00066 [halophilic archaeon J07HB67]|nr:MAG: hypothetical protein J07HB67_00066 [halophilic archaeon J07HB67]
MTELVKAARKHVRENEAKYVAMGEAGRSGALRNDD